MAYKIKNKKPKKEKQSFVMEDRKNTFEIYAHNYSWHKNKDGTMRVSLGNMTDAGWYWDGDEKELNGFLFRLKNSRVRDDFLDDFKKENINFGEIKPQLIQSARKGDGLYEMSGDNVVWHFGEVEGDVDETYEIEESGLTKEQENKVYEEYSPITYEEFEKEYSSSFKKDMEEAVKKSDSIEELWKHQGDIAEDLTEKRINENQERFLNAIDKVKGNKK